MAERIAEWRIVPHEERALLAERRRWRGRRIAFQALALTGLAAPLVGLGVLNRMLPGYALGLLVAVLPALGLFALIRSARTVEASERYVQALTEEHGGVPGSIVEITVHQGEATTGLDHGVVWAEGGRLYFAGARTSFGLAVCEVAPGTAGRLATEKDGEILEIPLLAETLAGRVSLRLRPLDRRDASAAELSWLVRSWLAQGATGEGQLPPLALGPDVPGAFDLLVRATSLSLLWVASLSAFLLLLIDSLMSWCALPFLLGPLAFVALLRGLREYGTPWERWRAWADRRRLEAG